MRGHALKFGSIALLALGSAGLASAADLRMPVKAPPPVVAPAFSWSGCYLGGFVGGASNDRDPTFTDQGNATFRAYSGGITAGRVENPHAWGIDLDTSFIGGGTVGCNWQAPGSPFVLGVEGEAGFLSLKGAAFDPLLAPNLPVTALRTSPDVLGSAKVGDWYGMITGRLGYGWDRALIYVKGGAAFVPVRGSVSDTCLVTAGGCGNWIVSTAAKDTVTTWTVGGGIEWAFTPNWSIKGEYMFIGLDDSLGSCGSATVASGATVGGGPFCFGHAFDGIHTAKLGVNYRFGSFWGP
jgi:outer membrane immunogenic protein